MSCGHKVIKMWLNTQQRGSKSQNLQHDLLSKNCSRKSQIELLTSVEVLRIKPISSGSGLPHQSLPTIVCFTLYLLFLKPITCLGLISSIKLSSYWKQGTWSAWLVSLKIPNLALAPPELRSNSFINRGYHNDLLFVNNVFWSTALYAYLLYIASFMLRFQVGYVWQRPYGLQKTCKT